MQNFIQKQQIIFGEEIFFSFLLFQKLYDTFCLLSLVINEIQELPPRQKGSKKHEEKISNIEYPILNIEW